jgi:hypothetical protein
MKTVGIDLATIEKNTAVCVLNWSETRVCAGFRDDTSDDGLIQICRDVTVDKVGIDCPFGWPSPFVAAISAHGLGQAWPGRGHPDPAAFRRTLAFRLTDLRVQETVWVPRTRSCHATCTYSCMRPPSRSRRSGRMAAPDRGGVPPAGGR